MFIISLVSYLEMAARGIIQIKNTIDAVKAGRVGVVRESGELVSAEDLQAAYDKLEAHAVSTSAAIVQDILRDAGGQ